MWLNYSSTNPTQYKFVRNHKYIVVSITLNNTDITEEKQIYPHHVISCPCRGKVIESNFINQEPVIFK